MGNTLFKFNAITDDELDNYITSSPVFNNCKNSIEKEKIILASFTDERFGSSIEYLSIAVYNNKWELLNIGDKIEGYNEIPLGYVLDGVEYSKVLVILRRMSDMIFDTHKVGVTTYLYNVISDDYKDLESDSSLYGILAKNHISFSDLDSLCEEASHIQDTWDRDYVLDWAKAKKGK